MSNCCMSRRGFLSGAAAVSALPGRAIAAGERQDPIRTPLVVQPVLLYQIPKRAPQRSWRPWGGIQTPSEAAEEKNRIGGELASMGTPFPLKVLPVAEAQTTAEAARIAQAPHDVTLVYAAGGGGQALEALAPATKWALVFVRHRSGPVSLWYEIAHPRFLRKTVDEYGQPGMTVEDVIVDSHEEVLWRLRAFYALKNTLGKRIVAVGGASGWGAGGRKAPELARSIWKMDLPVVGYPELGQRIAKARADEKLVRECRGRAEDYLRQKGVSLETGREFVVNAFVLTEVLRNLMAEAQTDAITINECMSTIMPMSETTACLPLSILNDEGYMAFCESDFVVIPSGVLLHYISEKPVFLNDPTHPHDGVVTLAHCTAPRKMDGEHAEPVRILTHFESDYGAAPKVEMARGQKVTVLDPDFGGRNWVGFEGEITDVPFLAICRSQIDVGIHGSCGKLLEEMKGFHWMASYGTYLRESRYALRKAGIKLTTV